MILLDTHTLIWSVSEDPRLGERAQAEIEDAGGTSGILVSAITPWEIALLVSRNTYLSNQTNRGNPMIDILQDWGWLAALIAAVFAIRGTVRFDLNKWLKDRQNQKEKHLKALCPHVNMIFHNEQPAIRSRFISPPGTIAWQCQRCGFVTHDRPWIDEEIEYWGKNPNELIKREKKVAKLARSIL